MTERPVVRVEQALRLLPDLDVAAPLRALVVAASQPHPGARWPGAAPYLTLSKRAVDPEELRRRLPYSVKAVEGHIAVLFDAYIEALERHQEGDLPGAVAALLRAGRREEESGRLTAARAWYERALALGEEQPARHAEIEALNYLGHLHLRQGQHPLAARAYQRSLALAEAEFHQAAAIAACLALGDVALSQQQWGGAAAWYSRGQRLAEAAGDDAGLARLERQLGILKGRSGEPAAAAEYLSRARDRLERSGDALELARVLNAQGQLDARLARPAAALAAYQEALAWYRRAPAPAETGLEVGIRFNLARLQLAGGRLLPADEEARRAEQLAITHGLNRWLIQVYGLMGTIRGEQNDQTGFVFFEQAIELCRSVEHAPALEAQVYRWYGTFKQRMGESEEGRAYLQRAQELLDASGTTGDLEDLPEGLEQRSA